MQEKIKADETSMSELCSNFYGDALWLLSREPGGLGNNEFILNSTPTPFSSYLPYLLLLLRLLYLLFMQRCLQRHNFT